MTIEGKYIDINEWDPPGETYKKILGEGWHSFKEFNSNIPEDTPTVGYRIFYQQDDKYYSPFVKGGINNVGEHPEKAQQIGIPLQSPTENGYYYYFVNRDVAENYLAALIVQTHRDMIRDPEFRPTGTFQIHPVEGIAAGPSVFNNEGDRMKEMYAYKDPIITVALQELWPKTTKT